MPWAWLAIGLGALIIATRAPLIFRPVVTLEIYRGLWATDARGRGFGVLYLALAVLCVAGAGDVTETARQLLTLAAALLLALAVWPLAAPAHFRGVIDRVVVFVEESVDTAAIRVLAGLAVCFGGLLVWVGVRAL